MVSPQERIIEHPHDLAAFCEALSSRTHFGLDTEFVGEESYHPQLCLVQVATEDTLALIDPLAVGSLECFWKLVTEPDRVVIVHAGREEARLCQLFTGKPPGRLFDVQIAAGLVGLPYPLGHGNLVSRVLGTSISKTETRTEWRQRPLTASQIAYAYDDVRFLLPLWVRLEERLQKLDRSTWAAEEFQRLATQPLPGDMADGRWQRLRGIGSLSRRQLGIVRALYQWREERAERMNRPPRTICRDDLLVEVARRNPKTGPDLHVVRGLPRRDIDAIMRVVEKARAIPSTDLPPIREREQEPAQVSIVGNVLSAVLGDFCARSRLAGGLVANSQDLRSLVRTRLDPKGAEDGELSLLSHGWRAEHVLPHLRAVLEGQKAVRVVDIASESPLAVDTPPGHDQG